LTQATAIAGEETAARRPLLRMEGIAKSFGATKALSGVDLEVYAGEVVALIGENGAGKSTLMKVLSGAHAPDAGSMWLDGRPYAPANPFAARRAGVAMIYQELVLAPDLSVAENILLGVEPHRGPLIGWGEMRKRAREALEQVGRPTISVDAKVASLSAAERQLVEIARAVALSCRMLVLDEPTSSLGKADVENLFELVRRLQARGTGIVYISHFLEEVRAVAQRYTVLRDGNTVGAGRMADVTDRQIVAMMVGRNVEDLYPRSPRTAGEAILEVHGLSGKAKPVGADLTLHRGEVVGIAGLIGAGRTEFLRTLFGLDEIVAGKIRIGVLQGPRQPEERWQQRVGMVSEDRKNEGLATGLSIAENLTMPSRRRWASPRRLGSEAQRWTSALGVKCRSASQTVGELSGGNQQKVALARLLHHGVDVLLLDEPTRGIDVGTKADVFRIIDNLAREGKAVLMVSSYLPELLGVCDRIAVMCKGRLGPARPVGQLDEHRIMLEAIGASAGREAT
jgi:ribose transport system ATP-binding protein